MSCAGPTVQEAITEKYIVSWATSTTREGVFPTPNAVMTLGCDVIFDMLNVTREAARQVALTTFRFPMKRNPARFFTDICMACMKRDISVFHTKTKTVLFDAYIKRLVQDGYGRWVTSGRKAKVTLNAAEAHKLLKNNQ